jgi:hypothetical protein
MFRRTVIVSAVAACALSGLVGAHADLTGNPPPSEMPRVGCPRRLVDPEGDAKWPAALGQNAQKIDGLDLNGVLLRLTPAQLQVFISAKDLVDPAHMPATAGAFAYTATFKYGEVLFTFKFMENSSQAPWTVDKTASTGYPVGGTGVGGAAALPGRTGDAYYDTNFVVFTAPRTSVEDVLGTHILDTDKFTSVTASAIQYQDQTQTVVDSLDVPVADAAFTAGDEYCFGAPPGTLSDLVTPAAVYSDPVTLSAKLVNEAGAPVAGKPVRFTVAGEKAPVVGTTNADGVATATYVPALGAGTYAVEALFPGDTEVGKAKLAGTIVVATETSVLNPLAVAKPNATTRTVTATLADNDKHLVAGQKVDWYVNGKKLATVATDAKGRSLYKSAKPGQTVQAKYPGLAGKYTAAASKAVKA